MWIQADMGGFVLFVCCRPDVFVANLETRCVAVDSLIRLHRTIGLGCERYLSIQT
jgi:hypothetical protein